MTRAWVFGLSIDTEVACGLAEVDTSPDAWGDGREGGRSGPPAYPGRVLFFKLADRNTTWPSPQQDLARALDRLRQARDLNRLFGGVRSIGICSVGAVGPRTLWLLSPDRLAWRGDASERTLDIMASIQQAFPEYARLPFSIHNDATAKAAAYRCFEPSSDRGLLGHVLIGEGANVGVAGPDGALSPDLHPEMGHGYPHLHPLDAGRGKDELRRVTGCNQHVVCYEGLAAGMRAAKDSLSREAWREILTDYAGQLCWGATVALRPSRIRISGGHVGADMLGGVRARFDQLNNGAFTRQGSPEQSQAWLDNFIQLAAAPIYDAEAAGISNPDGVMGALELARAALRARADDSQKAQG